MVEQRMPSCAETNGILEATVVACLPSGAGILPAAVEQCSSGRQYVAAAVDSALCGTCCAVLCRRQPTLEEREALEMEALEQDRLAIKLERLHFDGRS